MGKMFQALVEEYRVRMEKLVGTATVSGDHLANARAAYQDLAERARQADEAVRTMEALMPVRACSRCGESRRCVPVDRRDGSRDVVLCTSCIRDERAALQGQLAEHKAQERKLREELGVKISALEKCDQRREELFGRLASAGGDVDPGGFDA